MVLDYSEVRVGVLRFPNLPYFWLKLYGVSPDPPLNRNKTRKEYLRAPVIGLTGGLLF